ncbi:heme peroxidase-domain-containing protein [Xylariaceae sp. FL0804]|nr:heme peroxidase-domain-containing protein [Xylariaceae sp. FL0804]
MSPFVQRPPTDDRSKNQATIDKLNEELKNAVYEAKFHGDESIGDKLRKTVTRVDDFRRIFSPGNIPDIVKLMGKMLGGQVANLGQMKSGAKLVASMSNDSTLRASIIEGQVKTKYERMLHPPLTYLGDTFKYRTVDGKFNSALHPQLGQAGAPYAKTVPSKTHQLGALPDPGDLFDLLMAREESENGEVKGRVSKSGLSSMLIYHATLIIHDIFRTNDEDKNISDSSSYLDLSPLYGFTEVMQRKVRDDKYKLGLLKPDTFAEDRLLRQPPGVCIMLVMYNRYHNYAATQLRRINENNRFSVPEKYVLPRLAAAAKNFVTNEADQGEGFDRLLEDYGKAWKAFEANDRVDTASYSSITATLQVKIDKALSGDKAKEKQFYKDYDAAWDKLDDDLFNTARLITCGMYIQIAIHDYLRALMGFHQYDTDFTLDPRINMTDHKEVTRGIGNQVTVEFNLLYRFHCAISLKDEKYAEDFLRKAYQKTDDKDWNPKDLSMQDFMRLMAKSSSSSQVQPWEQEFGLTWQPDPEKNLEFKRNPITGLFDDQQMIDELKRAMDDPISNFGPRNIPRALKPIEELGIIQARKWGIGTLNDFREFFGMKRHATFDSITPHLGVQNALRDLYEHPDKVELYPGVFCESDKDMNADPGPSDVDSALWAAIFSDAITLVRSDRFYTVDWNTESLTAWGMKEVTADKDVAKSSVFHRLLQRAFPEWFSSQSIHFFHPFYTSAKNAEFAQQQGYADMYKMQATPIETNILGRPTKYAYNTEMSQPKRPQKPIYLQTGKEIQALLDDDSGNIVHSIQLNLQDLPPKMGEVLKPGVEAPSPKDRGKPIEFDDSVITKYLVNLMMDIVKREVVKLKEAPKPGASQRAGQAEYQLDVTRDFAITVMARYVVDFLGFGNQVRSSGNPGARYSEEEIYRHITNCQVFLSYNSDETKAMKRRQAFRTSVKLLFELAQNGNIRVANRWAVTRWAGNALGRLFGKRTNPMTELGFKVAQQVLEHEPDADKAAAIFLLAGLDSVYNTVLAFTAVLDFLLKELYGIRPKSEVSKNCDWLQVQKLAFDPTGDEKITEIVLEAQRKSVRLPIIRKAFDDCQIKDKDGNFLFNIQKGQTIICDIFAAGAMAQGASSDESDYLAYRSSFTEKVTSYHPSHVAALSLTAMIKVLGQMKNLRRGHDAQGRLKRVNVDSSYEGYSNYMAPGRMRKIAADVQKLQEKAQRENNEEEKGALSKLFNAKILKPTVHTYLTPEWDEMVPFPTTWKVRFDGFGESDYGGAGYPLLQQPVLPDWVAPFYQRNGASHYGGSFAATTCICREMGSKCTCKEDKYQVRIWTRGNRYTLFTKAK